MIAADSFSKNKVVVINVYQSLTGFTVDEVVYTNGVNTPKAPPSNAEQIQFALTGKRA